jgi:chaperonin GroES
MNLQPLHDRIIVKPLPPEEVSKGGIILAPKAQETPQEGTVIAAGPGITNDKGELVPLSVKAGDRVIFGKYSGSETEIDGERVIVMREADIQCIVEYGVPQEGLEVK